MKVLLVSHENPATPLGGLGIFIREFSLELKKHLDCKVLFLDNELTIKDGKTPEFVDYCIQPEARFPTSVEESRYIDTATKYLTQIIPILAEFKPDIIHCNDRQSFLPFKDFDNVIYSSHLVYTDLIGRSGLNTWVELEHKIEALAVRDAKEVVAYSQFQQRILKHKVYWERDAKVLPLGADLKSYYRDTTQKSVPRLAFYGRFHNEHKGFDLFIKVARKLKEKYERNISIVAYGKGEVEKEFREKVLDQCEFLDGKSKYDALSKVDMVLMPSRYEPFGLAGLEALASGCILFAPSSIGMDEYLTPENHVKINDQVENITKKVCDVIDNIPRYEEMRKNAIDSTKNWTWSNSVNEHIKLYKKILS